MLAAISGFVHAALPRVLARLGTQREVENVRLLEAERYAADVRVGKPRDASLPREPGVVALIDAVLAGKVQVAAIVRMDQQIGDPRVLGQAARLVDQYPMASAIDGLVHGSLAESGHRHARAGVDDAPRQANAGVERLGRTRVDRQRADRCGPAISLLGRKALAEPLPGAAAVRGLVHAALAAQVDHVGVARMGCDAFRTIAAQACVVDPIALAPVGRTIEAADVAACEQFVEVVGAGADGLNPSSSARPEVVPSRRGSGGGAEQGKAQAAGS